MAFESVNYQCPACGGPLHFASAEQKLVCDYCDSRFEVEEVEALYRERQDKADAKADAAAATPKPVADDAGQPDEPSVLAGADHAQRPGDPVEQADRVAGVGRPADAGVQRDEFVGGGQIVVCQLNGGHEVSLSTDGVSRFPCCG